MQKQPLNTPDNAIYVIWQIFLTKEGAGPSPQRKPDSQDGTFKMTTTTTTALIS